MAKKILITGCAGYIGDIIVRMLANENYDIVGLDNLYYGGMYLTAQFSFTFVRGDIRDYNLLDELFKKHRFDAVIHTAALVGDGACQVNPELTRSINERATKKIAELCKEYNSRIIFFSTCSVYGANNSLLDEDSPTNPLSLYAATKLEAEKHVKEVPNHLILRLGTVFGFGTSRIRNDLVANIMTIKAFRGEKLTAFGGNQWRPMIYVWDIARIACQAISLMACGTVIVAHANYSVKEIANEVIRQIPTELEITDMKYEDQRNYKVNINKAKQLGLIADTSLSQGIQDMKRFLESGRISDVWQTTFHNEKYLRENGTAKINQNI